MAHIKPSSHGGLGVSNESEQASTIAATGRPGPVLLDIPLNIQKQDVNVDDLFGFDQDAFERSYNLDIVDRHIDQYFADLAGAERPVLMVGGGVGIAQALDEILELAEILGIPAYPTWNALDIVPSDFEFYGGRIGTYGGAGRNFGIQNSDLLLAVGSRKRSVTPFAASGSVIVKAACTSAPMPKSSCSKVDPAPGRPPRPAAPKASLRISSKSAREALSPTFTEVSMAAFNSLTALNSSARSFSNCCLTLRPTLIGPTSVMLGVPSRNRMRSISFSA